MPEALVEVAELVDPLGAEPEGLADDLGGLDGALAGPAVERGQLDPGQGFGELLGELGHLGLAAVAERDVEDALDAVLLVVDGRAGSNQDHLGHSRDGGSAVGTGPPPR